jgi:DNA polymerase-3 subunit epsilon
VTAAWHEGWVTALDLETTGVDPYTARIVTSTVVHVDFSGATPPISFTRLTDPGVDIPEAAANIHGITTERARAEGSPPADNLGLLLGQLTDVTEKLHYPLVVMNARYDLTVLREELARHHVDGQLPDLHVLDPSVIDKHMDTYRRGSRKLGALCQRYDVPHGGAHDSTQDALAAARIVWRQAREYPLIRMYSVQQLHTAQIRWAAEQAVSLQAWFRSEKSKAKGTHDPQAVVDPSWPVLAERAVTTP